jgi:chemotaxis protein CheD
MTVGVSDMQVSNDPDTFLITYSLGPCIGLILYDPIIRAGGMLHYQLPAARGHEARARQNPYMFADMGIPMLLNKVLALGAKKERMRVSVFGGASMMRDENIFKIGIQNARAAKKILWQQCVPITNEDVGGRNSRTVSIDIETGDIRLRSDGTISLYR